MKRVGSRGAGSPPRPSEAGEEVSQSLGHSLGHSHGHSHGHSRHHSMQHRHAHEHGVSMARFGSEDSLATNSINSEDLMMDFEDDGDSR